jgi:putative acyl-CoA dehydrogenase
MTLSSPLPLLQDAETHEVINVGRELENYNLFTTDTALQQAITATAPALDTAELRDFGALLGRRETIRLGFQANENSPRLHPHDRFGRRIDEVEYHPAYHALMELSVSHGLHSLPWTEQGADRHVKRAAMSYLMTQVEAGHACPVTMTFACVPTLQHDAGTASAWLPGVTSRQYDPRNVPWYEKQGLTIGMAMSEKQGGSDVRANTTRATPLGTQGPGQLYQLVGHKFFMSAPMCDGFLVLAQAPGGLSCFLMPRWREDGKKNPLFLQRLKHKMGNVSNASSEVEFRGAHAWLIGEEGRGIATIIEMVSLTRFDCITGSAAVMRQSVAQATFHCLHREAFGKRLIDQPLMQNVLCDLAIESEAAMHLSLRVAAALDRGEHDWLRLATPVGKFQVCKRTAGVTVEAMECIGGSGVMELSVMPRLYRESPINAIWEGSGNIQALDVFRALQKNPSCADAFVAELETAMGRDHRVDAAISEVKSLLGGRLPQEWAARQMITRMAVTLQAALLVKCGHPASAEGFIATRLQGHDSYGSLPAGIDIHGLLERALPV